MAAMAQPYNKEKPSLIGILRKRTVNEDSLESGSFLFPPTELRRIPVQSSSILFLLLGLTRERVLEATVKGAELILYIVDKNS